jgi:nitrogen fixation protein FixH
MSLSWPTGIGLSLGCFVALQISLVVFSARGFEGPDHVRYYKMGLEYSQEVERQQRQRESGWQLLVGATPSQPLFVRLVDAKGKPLQGRLKVFFKRPATLTLDHYAEVKAEKDGYLVNWKPQPGWWNVEFEFTCRGQRFVDKKRWWWP